MEEESWERKKRARDEDEQEKDKLKVEEFMRWKSSSQEEGGAGEQIGVEDSPEDPASTEVHIEPAVQTPLDTLDDEILGNEASSQLTNIQENDEAEHGLQASLHRVLESLP
jgi:hypothetical protein